MSKFHDMTIHILGRLDCQRVTHLKTLIGDMKKEVAVLPTFDFKLEFETQFDLAREELLKEDLAFLKYEKSPVIYSTSKLRRNKINRIFGGIPDVLHRKFHVP